MAETKSKLITVYTESNPNPNSLKFVVDFLLVQPEIIVDYPDKESAKNCPLAVKLFELDYVTRVFISSNFVTVTKSEGTDWYEVIPEIKSVIKSHLEKGEPLFLEEPQPSNEVVSPEEATASGSEIDNKIKMILNDYIRPAVEQDGGNISFHSFEEGTVKVLLQGACSGCPSSTLTLKAGIENLLKKMVPEVKEVVAEGV